MMAVLFPSFNNALSQYWTVSRAYDQVLVCVCYLIAVANKPLAPFESVCVVCSCVFMCAFVLHVPNNCYVNICLKSFLLVFRLLRLVVFVVLFLVFLVFFFCFFASPP